MGILGKNGFIRQQEVAFARKLLVWKYEQSGLAFPGEEAISAHAEQVVDDAHRIAKESGRNVLKVMENTIKDFKI